MKMQWNMVLCALALLLSACGGGMSGTYEDSMGLTRFRFENDGQVLQSSVLAGVEQRMRYEMEGERILMRYPEIDGAVFVLTRVDENTLSGPIGVTYKRVAN